MERSNESRIGRAQRLAAALAQLPDRIMSEGRKYRLDIDPERRRVEYVNTNYVAASFTCTTLAEAAETMVREFINPLTAKRHG